MIYVFHAIWLLGISFAESVFWKKYRGTNPGGLRFDNAHVWLLISRAPIFGAMAVADLKYAVFAALSFPFFHDGLYYLGRHIIDRDDYKAHFFDTSTNSTAWITWNFTTRTGVASLGILLFVFL